MTASTPMFVSIVIPMRNEEKYIGKALESILASTHPHDRLEVVLADGMSTDRTREVVQGFAGRGVDITVLDNPKRFTPMAMNIGIRAARGDGILIMSAHSTLAPDYIPQCLETMDRLGADVGGGVEELRSVSDDWQSRLVGAFWDSPFGSGGPKYRTATQDTLADTVTMGLYRREVFERAGLLDERLVRNQDNELNSRILHHGFKLGVSAKARLYYYHRATVRGLLRQMFLNGKYGILTWRVTPASFCLRHFIPFAFVAFVLGGLAASLLVRHAWVPYAAIWALYVALGAAGAVVAARRRKSVGVGLSLPALCLAVHLAYGLGTFLGLFRFGFSRISGQVETLAPRRPAR